MLFLRIDLLGSFLGCLLGCFLGCAANGLAQEPPHLESLRWERGPTGTQANLRGLSAYDGMGVWACGSDATVIRSSDGGSSWVECGPREFETLEFRSIHAWDERSACIASAGSPAVILLTQDGGVNWHEAYRHPSPRAFFDGLKFWDSQRGMVFGDPVEGKLCVLESADGGRSWQALEADALAVSDEGEAGFAASNSAMAIGAGGKVWIGTGGRVATSSHVWRRESWSGGWTIGDCPLISGPTQGIFSIAAGQQQPRLIAVGGDYRAEEKSATTAAISEDGGNHWRVPQEPPTFFCSAIACVPAGEDAGEFFIATGPSGSAGSLAGEQWTEFSQTGFHVLTIGGQRTVFAAGAEGRFARLILGR